MAAIAFIILFLVVYFSAGRILDKPVEMYDSIEERQEMWRERRDRYQ